MNPVTLAAVGAEMDGLAFMRAVAAGELPPPPIATLLGFDDIDEIEEGRIVFRGTPRHEHYNTIGLVHGGWAMTLLDSAMGSAVHTTLPAGTGYTSLEVKTNFVRPITVATGPVVVTGEVLHRGSRIATAEGRMVVEETGKLLAHATTTILLIPR